jgi:hypothetical protein
MSNYDFYGVNIVTPLSGAHGTQAQTWDASLAGRLANETDGQVHVVEIPFQHLGAAHGWRVVDAFWSDEDGIMTSFRCYDLEGNMLPEATFGVNYGSVPNQLMGGFKYRPHYNREYFIPVANNFATPNTGGYTVQVLDLLNPSEGMAFGLSMDGKRHRALVISFRLFELGDGYPNDLDILIR